MPKPVYLLTVQEPHKEYNSLMDQIWAKYEQLGSGKYGTVGIPAFNAEACELANLLAHVSQLCQKLNLPPPKELYWPMFLGGLSIHLNHLIASHMTNYDWPFGTLLFGLFGSNLDTRDLETYPRT